MSLDTIHLDVAATAPVATVILVHETSDLSDALDAVEAQVYEHGTIFVAGGDEAIRAVATERGAVWARTLAQVLGQVDRAVEFVWLVHDRARPRPGALRALVEESRRVDAAIAGSKLLDRDDPDHLISIGTATDVFEVPYSGLDPDERDQHQYEVMRDVAMIAGASMLVRRDLLLGLGGIDPRLAPEAAATDFCQRARLHGARVVVVPSSEVLYPAPSRRRTPSWQEEAGRIRAMIKAYSVVTLLWALPGALLTALVEAIVAPFLGRWTLLNLIRAWAWNLVMLPSTVVDRRKARRGRVVGDAELFRYQLRGSARLRYLLEDVVARIRERLPETTGIGGLVEAGQQTIRSPVFVAAAAAVVFVALATRSIWSGTLPAVGYTLPPAESATDQLRAYAGGWNVAGFGSPEPLPPAIGAIALFQYLLLGRPELTATLLTIGALIAGIVGMARLLRLWEIDAVAAYFAGAVFVAGPATQALAGRTEWTALLALGALPWAIRSAVRPWPERWPGRAARIGSLAALTGLAAAGLPALLVVPTAVVAVWALIGAGSRWWGALRAAAGALLAVPLLFPWFEVVSLADYLQEGRAAFWNLWLPAALVVIVAAGAALLVGERHVAAVAGWGMVLAAGGVLLARTGSFDYGRHVAATGMVLAALGVAAVAGAALELFARIEVMKAWRRPAAAVGVVAGVALVASVLGFAAPGRAGLPGDVYRQTLAFTSAQVENPQSARVLVAGPAADLPGDARFLEGAAYRVMSAPLPRLWEAHLPEPRMGDRALEETLRSLIEGEVARAGEALAPFGIRWVVLVGDTPFQDLFAGQLDMVPLASLAKTVFLSEVPALRAVADDGSTWIWRGPDYRSDEVESTTAVYVAENGDRRWGPGSWEQSSWGNRLVASDAGEIRFAAHAPYQRWAQIALGLFVLYVAVAVVGRMRRFN